MHSCKRGILIEQYDKLDYYKRRFLFAGRLPVQNTTREEIDIYSSIQDSLEISEDTISIIGVGDMMLGTNYPADSYLPPNDGKDILAPVKDILIDADLTFGNMEGTMLSDSGDVKKCSNPAVCYAFKSPDHYISYFKEAGFDVLSLANNHSGDFGVPGKTNTVRLLKENAIEFAGLLEYPFTIFVKDSITYGFCAFAPNNGTVSFNDHDNAVSLVKHLDSLCDVVIVSFHGGAEGSSRTHITKSNEIFLGENRGNPYKFSRAVIDAGADIVFGHGPHVTRAIDIYKGRFIAYSLGNFATYGRFNLKGVSGIAPIVKVYVNEKGEFISGQIFSTKQIGEGGPILDPEQRVLKEMITLNKIDVPESKLVIDDNGQVCIKQD
ncbi:MAG: CapA family protein [Cytophagaceae bacterium]|nr:CapA family protein [Cytophagaceae bacterium]